MSGGSYYYTGTGGSGGDPLAGSAVVIDIGSHSTKIGWAGDDYPRCYFRSEVGVRRDGNVSSSGGGRRRIVRGEGSVKYDFYSRPIHYQSDDDGDYEPYTAVDVGGSGLLYESVELDVVQQHARGAGSTPDSAVPDWYDMLQEYVEHGFNTGLAGCVVPEHPLVFVEKAYNLSPIRQKIVECLFEGLGAPAAFLARDAALQCYGVGRTTAVSVDLGYSGTTVAPVCDGYVEQRAVQRCPTGLRAVDQLILEQMDRLHGEAGVVPLYQVRRGSARKASIHAACRLREAQLCRESGAGIAINTTLLSSSAPVSKGAFHAPSRPYELPDGTTIEIPSVDRFEAADYLLGGQLPRRRRDCELARQQLLHHCSAASAALAALHDAGDKTNDSVSDSAQASDHDTVPGNPTQAALAQQEQLAAAAAVGIITRKDKEDFQQALKRRQGLHSTQRLHQQQYIASYVYWHRAIAGEIHTMLRENQITHNSVGAMICDAAYRCDRDQQASLLGSVVLGGGGAASVGPTEQAVPDAIKDAVEQLIHAHTPGWRVKVYTPTALSERAVLPWLGGSILGSLNAFQSMYVTKAEYEEWGPVIVNRKCP